MKASYVNVGGVWKKAINIWQNINGVWTPSIIPWIKEPYDWVWYDCFESPPVCYLWFVDNGGNWDDLTVNYIDCDGYPQTLTVPGMNSDPDPANWTSTFYARSSDYGYIIG